jgi:hypothetical protein
MKVAKIMNYIAGALCLVHAGLVSLGFSAVFNYYSENNLDPTDINAAFQVPYIYSIIVLLILFSAIVLLCIAITTLILNLKLPKTELVRRPAVTTSIMTIFTIVLTVLPQSGTILCVLLCLLYVIFGYLIGRYKKPDLI